MVAVQSLTPEAMLAAPRRSPAVPNRTGTLALYSVSTHSFETNQTTKEGRVMDITVTRGPSSQLWEDEDVTEATWIPGTDSEILYLKKSWKGKTKLMVADGADVEKEHYVVGEVEGGIQMMKLKELGDGSVAIVVVGLVGDDGGLFNKEPNDRDYSGRVFDNFEVRAWNVLFEEKRYSLWYTKLVTSNGKWSLASELNLLVKDPKYEAPMGMYQLLEGQSNFDVTSHGIAYSTRDLTKYVLPHPVSSTVWYIPIDDFTKPPTVEPKFVNIDGKGEGFAHNVRFTPDGAGIGFLFRESTDFNDSRLMMVNPGDLNQQATSSAALVLDAVDVMKSVVLRSRSKDYGDDEDPYRDPPAAFEFAGSSNEVFLMSEIKGKVLISSLELKFDAKPRYLTKSNTASAFFPLRENDWSTILVSSSNFVDYSLWQLVGTGTGFQQGFIKTLSSGSKEGMKFGVDWDEMVEEIWYEGADGLKVQSWMIKPMGFDKNKKYPYMFLPHGGPVSHWPDAWSTRWNPAVFAEHGYITIMPNITGSQGFGLEFMKRVDDEWGGRPVTDLLKLLDHLETLPYLDQSRAILAGASYSGYLVSWFFGLDIISKFCGAIWHDGMFSTSYFELQTDIVEWDDSFGGKAYPWLNHKGLEKFNPARPERLAKWKNAPPTLVIHSEKDYRCPVTEGLATFRTLQAHAVPSRFLTFEDECHWVLKPGNARFWYKTVFDWMDRCASGELNRKSTTW